MKLNLSTLLLALVCLLTTTRVTAQTNSDLLTPVPASKVDKAQLSSYAQFAVNQQALVSITKQRPEQLEIYLAFEGGLQLELIRQDITEPGFQVYSGTKTNKQLVNYQPGAHYQGKIAGHEQSLVAINFFENEIIGVVSDARGNINFGTLKSADKSKLTAVVYRETAHQNPPYSVCEGGVELADNSPTPYSPDLAKTSMPLCFTQYLEADFSFYQARDSSVIAAVNWLVGSWNIVSAIYAVDEITATISEIFVWTEPDSYDHSTTNRALNDFRDAMTLSDFNGDLAHLITSTDGIGGGRAFIRSICNNAPNLRTAYSRMQETYNDFPEFSFSTYVIAHEIGHNLGSSHTHRCVWNGNSTQIDDAGNLWALNEDEFIEGTFCFDSDNLILPAEGATIMSYGHLIEDVGINYSLGFGLQPASVIRTQLMLCSNCDSGFGCTDSDAHNYDSLAINENGTCLTCSDSIQNGDELGIDCGGQKCMPCENFTVSGQLRRPDNSGVVDFEVILTSNDLSDTLVTDSLGDFIEPVFLSGSNVRIEPLSPEYTPGEPNGVSVLDVVAIQRHILQLSQTPLTAYQLLAADVDGNQLITVTDLIHIVQFILAIRDDFDTGQPWFFVDADYVFTDPQQPWLDDYPDFREINNLTTDSLQNDFIVIQRGGVRAAATNISGE